MTVKTVLITGGAGFIGSNISDYLLLKGHNVIVIDNFDNFYCKEKKINNFKHNLNNKLFHFIEGDIRDNKTLENTFKIFKIDLVIHLAARSGVRPSITHPAIYFDVNISGTLNILESMRNYGVKKMIHASSSSVYGNNVKFPFSEADDADNPISPYASSKRATELMIRTYCNLFEIDAVILRFFSVYGRRQRPDLIIHKFFHQIINSQPIEIFGNGLSSRDYTYIDDISDGLFRSMQYLVKNSNTCEIINLGNSNPISLIDLIELIEKITDKKSIRKYSSFQIGDAYKTFADIQKAKSLLAYDPKISIEEGLARYFSDIKMGLHIN